MSIRATIKQEGDEAVIRIPFNQIHSLRVALEPCPCRAPKSLSTENIRIRLARALGYLESKRK